MLPCDIFLERWTFRQGWCIVFFSRNEAPKRTPDHRVECHDCIPVRGTFPFPVVCLRWCFFTFYHGKSSLKLGGYPPPTDSEIIIIICSFFYEGTPLNRHFPLLVGPGGTPKLNSIWGLKLLFQGATFFSRLSSQEMIFNRQNLGDMGCSFAPLAEKAKKGPRMFGCPVGS